MFAHFTLTWLKQSTRRVALLLAFFQPLTATQLSRKTKIRLDCCSFLLLQLASHVLIKCMNPTARRSRIYWLTSLGLRCQALLPDAPTTHECPAIDWNLHGALCHSQRSTVLRTLKRPMQPTEIRRRAVFQDDKVTMNSSNVRDVLRFLLANELVKQIWIRKKAFPRYDLTELGKTHKRLLCDGAKF